MVNHIYIKSSFRIVAVIETFQSASGTIESSVTAEMAALIHSAERVMHKTRLLIFEPLDWGPRTKRRKRAERWGGGNKHLYGHDGKK